jgi:glycosyltransferase involved in cell wall biosynthesis
MVKVFLACSGLGNINRGFESFIRECFEALSQDDSLDITLFKGGGKPSKKEITLWNLRREKWTSIQISRVVGRLTGMKGPYFTEQLSFVLSLLPYIYFKKPDVIYFSDEQVGVLLWYWRRWTRQSYKLLFSNGAPTSEFHHLFRWDYVHQIAPTHLQDALDVGVPAEKQSLVPYGIHIRAKGEFLTPSEREALRHRLGLPEKRPLILSVGVIDKSHKRMDYVIRELGQLPEPRPYLLLLGQQEAQAAEISQLANSLLGSEHFQIRTVAHNEIAYYYKIADAFVLASVREGLPRVLPEAMSYGLPSMAHDYEISHFALGEEGYFADFEVTGNLASLIPQALAESHELTKRYLRHQTAYNRFSWEKLLPDYIKLIQNCANSQFFEVKSAV